MCDAAAVVDQDVGCVLANSMLLPLELCMHLFCTRLHARGKKRRGCHSPNTVKLFGTRETNAGFRMQYSRTVTVETPWVPQSTEDFPSEGLGLK